MKMNKLQDMTINQNERELLKSMLPEVTQLLEQAKQVQTQQDSLTEGYQDLVDGLNTTDLGDFELQVNSEAYIIKVKNEEKVKGMTLLELISTLGTNEEQGTENNLVDLHTELLLEGTTEVNLEAGQKHVVAGLIKIVEEKGKVMCNINHIVARYKGVTVRDYKNVQIVEIFNTLTFTVTDDITTFTLIQGTMEDFKAWFEIKLA